MNTLRKYWKMLASAVGAIVGLILLRQFFQKDLKAKLMNTEADKQSELLNQKAEGLNSQAKELSQANEELKAQVGKADKLDPTQVVDYWKKN